MGVNTNIIPYVRRSLLRIGQYEVLYAWCFVSVNRLSTCQPECQLCDHQKL